jgi:hypothetical protein
MRKCEFCGKNVEDDKPFFYIGYWDRYRKMTSVLHYHTQCFKEIAGEEYVKKIIKN